MKTKNTKNITLALLLVLCTALFALPAMAQELTIPSARTQVTLSETIDEQELFDGFALRELYGMRGISTWGVAARETLSDRMKNLYDALKPEIEKVALGQRASTVFTFTAEEAYDMGFNTVFTCAYDDISDQIAIFNEQMTETSDLMLALMLDCPYDMYWFDQTKGVTRDADDFDLSGSYESMTGSCGHVYFYFSVAPKFQNGDQYSMDTSFGANATAAAQKAAQIIENAKSMSDREKLEYYCEQICALTTYDHTAAANPSVNYSLDSNPWQLINVFDGDPDTNVVCEGYSKAFQYLCDETSFSSSSTMSYLVSGVMTGATGAGNHMWNVVTLSGINYLVDVTNSDVGSVGNAEYFDPDPLFLSLPASGTTNTTYTFIAPSVSIGGGYYTEEATIAYSYDEKTLDMWGEDILTLGGEAHTCDFSGETTYEYLNAAQHSVIVKCTGCDKTQTTAVGHTETTAATCTDAAYCGDCKHSYGEKNTSAHPASAVITYTDNGNGKHTGSYSCCGASTDAEAHTFGADSKCSKCTAQAVAKVGDTAYALFDDALDNWTDGTTLTLLKDVTYSKKDIGDFSAGTNRTFDGGTYTLTLDAFFTNNGTLSITNGTLSLDSLVNNGVLNISGGSVINPNRDICPTIDNYGEFNFSGGSVSSLLGQVIYTREGSITTISDSAYISCPETSVDNNGTMIIRGGDITVSGISNWNGTLTISGGTLTSTSTFGVKNRGTMEISGTAVISGSLYSVINNENAELTIAGGSIINTNGGIAVGNSGTLIVSGGSISSEGTSGEYNYFRGIDNDDNGIATISGTAVITGSGTGVHNARTASMTISGSSISGSEYGVGNFGTLTIEGGSITGDEIDLRYFAGTTKITAGIPENGWTLCTRADDVVIGTDIVLPNDYHFYINDEIVTNPAYDASGVIRKAAPHTCDFSGEVTYEYLSDTQHNVIVKCTGCDKTQTAAVGHTESTAATCTDAAYCDECKHSYGEKNASAHPASAVITYTDNGNGKHTGNYSCCGAATEAEAHTFGADGKCSKCTAQAVAKVGDTAYALFDDALANWTDGTTLTLLADVTYDKRPTLSSDATRIFEGGSFTLDMVSGLIFNYGTLTINSGTITASGYNAPVDNRNELFITGGKLSSTYGASASGLYNAENATVTISGGTIRAEKGSGLSNYGKATISGGTFFGKRYGIYNDKNLTLDAADISSDEVGLYNAGTVTISSGTISSPGDILTNWGTAYLSGGTYTGTGSGFASEGVWNHGTMTISGTADISAPSFGIINTEDGSLTVTGGTISSDDRAIQNSGDLTLGNAVLSGGSFDLAYIKGTVTITGGVPADGWTFFTEPALAVGTELTLPAGHGLYVNDQIVTECDFYTSGVIRKISPHDCDFSGEPTYEYLSDTQHNVIVKCTGCGETQTTPENHTETTAATCTAAAYCGDCKHSYGEKNASAHPASAVISYADNKDGTHTGSYSCCGATTAAEAHTLGADGKCSKCTAQAVAILTEGGATSYLSTFKSLSETLSGKTAALTLLTDYTSENSSGALNAMDGANITIDLNSNSFEYSLIIHNGSAMTVKDSGETKGSFGNNSLSVKRGGSLTIEESAACEDWIIMNAGASGSITVGTEVILPDGCVLRNDRGLEITELAPNSWGYLHLHSFTYAASGSTITETCLRGCGHSATLTLCAPTELTYSASAKEATLEGSLANASAPAVVYSTADGSAPVDAGDYTASITVSGKTASVDFTIAPKALTANAEEITREYAADAALKAVALTLSGVISEDDVSGTADFILSSINAGTYTAAELTAYALTGEDADNYAIAPQDVAFTRATITKASADKWTADVAYGQDILVGSSLDAISFPSKGTGIGNEVVAITSAAAHTDAAATIPLTQDAILSAKKGDTLTLYYRIAAQNYEDRIGEMNLYFVEHEHDWTYSAKDNVITAVCSGAIGTCPNASVTLTLAAPTDLIYSGSAKEASVTVDPTGAIAAPAITYSTEDGSAPVNAGTYDASITLGDAAAKTSFTIEKAELTAADFVFTAPASLVYDGSTKNAKIMCTKTDCVITVKYNADPVNVGTYTVSIDVAQSKNYNNATLSSENWTFAITPASIAPATVAAAEQVYTGKELKPAITVTLGGKTLLEGTDFTVAYSGNVNVGTAAITVTGAGNYEGSTTGSFTIAPKTVSVPTFSGLEAIYVHTGSEVKPEFTLMDGSAVIPAEEYTVAYSNNVNLGTATITVADVAGGNYTVSGTATFEIAEHAHVWACTASGNVITATCSGTIGTCPIASKTATITLSAPAALTYDGSEKPASVTVDPTGAIAAPAITYSTEDGSAPVAAGTYTASVTLGGKTAMVNYTITKASLSGAEVTATGSFTYTGEAIVPTVAVSLGGKPLTEGADYTVAIANNVNAGTANVTVTGAGSYEGIAKATFAIAPASIAGAIVKAENQVYTGEALTPSVTVALGSKTLTAGTDYEITAYSGNTAAGTANVTVTGKGNYEGTANGTFDITQSASAMTAAADADSYTYGDVITVTAEVKATSESPAISLFRLQRTAKPQMALFLGGTQLTGYEDVTDGKCTLTYDTKEKGIAPADAVTLTVRYTGDANTAEQEATVTFGFTAKEVAPAITGSASKTYDGTANIPADNTLAIMLSGVLSVDNISASASYAFDGADAGEVLAVNASGISLTGSDAKFYTLATDKATASVGTITPASVTDAVVTADDQVYTGSALTPSVTVTLDGKTLVINQDYTVAGYENNTLVGTASVTVKGLGNYVGTATGSFEIVKASPVTKAPDGLVASYDSKLSDITLPEHTLGTWNWVSPTDAVGNVGEQKHQIVFTPFDPDQYSTITLTATVSVVKADMTFSDSFKVLLGSEESTVFTYGDTITVKAKPEIERPAMFMSLRAFSAPKANQMALFLGDQQISNAADADSTGVYTMAIDTTNKALKIGENAITAKYVGTDNVNDYSQTAAVTLNAKVLTITSVKANNRVYKAGNTLVTVTGAEFDGKVSADDDVNIAQVKGDVGSDAVGAYSSVLLPDSLSLTGKDASLYTLAAAASAPTSVEIVAIPADLTVEADVDETFDASDIPQSLKDAGFDTTDEVNDALRKAIDEQAAASAPEGSAQTEPANPIADTATSFVSIVYIEDGEKIEGDPEHFPADAPLKVLLPIPEGTDPDANEYFAAYMTTSETENHKPGEVITVPVSVVYDENGNPMLLVEITDIAPVMIGWTVKDVAIDLPETGDASRLGLWLMLMCMSMTAIVFLRKRSRC